MKDMKETEGNHFLDRINAINRMGKAGEKPTFFYFHVVHLLHAFLLEFVRLPEADPSTSSG
jgi:hypothetical protein